MESKPKEETCSRQLPGSVTAHGVVEPSGIGPASCDCRALLDWAFTFVVDNPHLRRVIVEGGVYLLATVLRPRR